MAFPVGVRFELLRCYGLGDWCLLHRLDVYRELHFVAHNDAARLERLIPVETEVPAIDLTRRAEAGPLVPPRILPFALERRLELDLAGNVADRQVADHAKIPVSGVALDTLAHESKGVVPRDVEEVRRT